MPYTYEYPRPAVTVDIAVFGERDGEVVVLLVQRKNEPFAGSWALPGGFVDANETLEHAAHRELQEETGLTGLALTQVAAFGDPGRDPRGHTVSIAFVTDAEVATVKLEAGDDAADARWHTWKSLATLSPGGTVRLAFDHATILEAARRLRDASRTNSG